MILFKRYYSLREVARILRISSRTITDYCKNGIIVPESCSPGRRARISREEIARILGLESLTQEFELLKPKEVAALLGKSENSIYLLHKKKPSLLRLIRLGRLWRAFAEDIKNFPHYD